MRWAATLAMLTCSCPRSAVASGQQSTPGAGTERRSIRRTQPLDSIQDVASRTGHDSRHAWFTKGNRRPPAALRSFSTLLPALAEPGLSAGGNGCHRSVCVRVDRQRPDDRLPARCPLRGRFPSARAFHSKPANSSARSIYLGYADGRTSDTSGAAVGEVR